MKIEELKKARETFKSISDNLGKVIEYAEKEERGETLTEEENKQSEAALGLIVYSMLQINCLFNATD